jgi:hypothetical protein
MTGAFSAVFITIAILCWIQAKQIPPGQGRIVLRALAFSIAFSPGLLVEGHGILPMFAWFAISHHLANLKLLPVLVNVALMSGGYFLIQTFLKRQRS